MAGLIYYTLVKSGATHLQSQLLRWLRWEDHLGPQIFFFFSSPGMEPGASCMLTKCSTSDLLRPAWAKQPDPVPKTKQNKSQKSSVIIVTYTLLKECFLGFNNILYLDLEDWLNCVFVFLKNPFSHTQILHLSYTVLKQKSRKKFLFGVVRNVIASGICSSGIFILHVSSDL